MRKIRKALLPILLILLFVFNGSVFSVYAENEQPGGNVWVEGDIALVPGFYCLHPHKKTPTPYDPIHMTAIPSTDYTGYPQDTLKQVAAAVILRGEYYRETGISVDDGSLQSVIWAIVCKRSECIMMGGGNLHLNGRDIAKVFYEYVMANYSSLSEDDYTMTIWVSSNEEYQDILEARLVEKHGVPSVEKKVLDTNDTDNTGDEIIGWQDSADYDIGDTIPFQITATLRDMPNFSAYYLEFVDHMEHMTLDPKFPITVTIDGKDVTKNFAINTTTEGFATDISVKCENILPLGAANGSKVVMTYNAILSEDALVGKAGNPNEVYLIYTRSSGTADKGISPKDKVKVFTYLMTVDKVDSEGHELKGAAFKLSKLQNGVYETVAVVGATENEDGTFTLTDENCTHFEWNGIDDGTYKLEEVVTPSGYNTIKPIEFWVRASHDRNSEDSMLHYVNSNYNGFENFIPAEFLEYSDDYSSIQNPEGYYGLEDAKFATKITNLAGTVLPSTGGMGTESIYIVGAAMVMIAGIFLVAKRKAQV